MSAPVIPSVPPGGLHARRCARHVTREAAARCPGCGEFFCRECVVEHDGRLLCASCLGRLAAKAERRGEWKAKAARIAAGVAGALLLWISFQAVGSLLLKIPPTLHEGTVWRSLEGEAR